MSQSQFLLLKLSLHFVESLLRCGLALLELGQELLFLFVGFELGGIELKALPLGGCLQFEEGCLVLLDALVLLEFVMLQNLIPVSFALLILLDLHQLNLLLQVLDALLEFRHLQLMLIGHFKFHQLQVLLEALALHLLANAVLLAEGLHVSVASLGFS